MKAQQMSLDIISNLPSCIIETILCLVPIEEAARTSVLSKEWRYKWTKIPKLEFYYSKYTFGESTDENEMPGLEQTIASERKKMGKRCKVLYNIYQVLLMRQDPIQEFTLEMEVDNTSDEINPIISYLTMNNALMKLKLRLSEEECGSFYRIPLSMFSLQQLTDLHLRGCDLTLKSTFNGFRLLTSLHLEDVYISRKTLLHLVSNCPLLKTFIMLLYGETIVCDDKYTVVELFDCLPMIERLTTWNWITECFVLQPLSQELPTVSLIHLKYVFYSCMSDNALYFLAFLMRCSPNVEKIEIEIFDRDDRLCDEISVLVKAYSDICLEHLNELKIFNFNNVESNLEFVRLILAKSPKLKKACLSISGGFDKTEQSEMLRILLHSPPASPMAEIVFR